MNLLTHDFPIDDAAIEVTFQRDPGGPGWGPNWNGDETGAIVKAGPLQIHVLFEVDEEKPPAEWVVGEIQVCQRIDDRLLVLVDETVDEEMVRPSLSIVPTVCTAVELLWTVLKAREELDVAKEDYWLIDASTEPEASQKAEARMRQLNTAYYARFGSYE